MNIPKIIFLLIGYGSTISLFFLDSWMLRIKVIIAVYFIALMKAGADHSVFYILFGLKPLAYKIQGYVKPGYENVRKIFEQNFIDGVERAAQCCVFVKGEKVVDLVGTTNKQKEEYNDRTLQLVYSSSKSISTLAIAMLVDRGLLKYEQKISEIWPEFGKNGKEDITLEQLLRHEAGLQKLKEELTPQVTQIDEIKKGTASKIIEDSTPKGIGVRHYHSGTRGTILSEIVRRVDPQSRTLGEFIQQEICKPLDIEYYTGIPEEVLNKKVVNSVFMTIENPCWLMAQSLVPKKLKKLVVVDAIKAVFIYIFTAIIILSSKIKITSKEYKTAELPSINGITNAYSLAKVASLLSQKGKQGDLQLFSKETNEQFHDNPVVKTDMMFRRKNKFNKGGNNVYTDDQYAGTHEDTYGFIGWQGMGGSIINWHLEQEIGFGYAMNLCDPDGSNLKGLKIRKVVYECAQKLK